MRATALFITALGLFTASPLWPQTANLKLFSRQDRPNGQSRLIITADPFKAKFNYAEDKRGLPLYARLWLPHPVEAEEKSFDIKEVYICRPGTGPAACQNFVDHQGHPLKVERIEAILPKAAVDALADYPISREETLPEGRRFEAFLEIKNLVINGEPKTAGVFVPSVPTLEYDPVSDFEDGKVVFRASYVPDELAPYFKDSSFWMLGGEPVCCVDDKHAPWMTFCSTSVTPRSQSGEMALVFKTPEVQSTKVQAYRSTATGGRAKANLRTFAESANLRRFTRRPVRPRFYGQALRFKTDAVTSSRDLPVFTRFAYIHSRSSEGKQTNIFDVEFSFNFDEKLGAPKEVVNPVGGLYMAPALHLNMSTNAFIDNENSLQWFLPVEWRHRVAPLCLDGSDCSRQFQPPVLRGVNFGAGLRGEHASQGQSQNLVVPITLGLLFNKKKLDKWAVQFEQSAGVELGRNVSETANVFTDAFSEMEVINKVPIRNDFVFRLASASKLSLSLSDQLSLKVNYIYLNLRREEQYLKEATIGGSFRPSDPAALIPFLPKDSPIRELKSTYSVFAPRLRGGPRQHLSIDLSYEIAPNIDLSVKYARGEMAPAFQFVNKFTVGVAFKYLGKLK